MYSVMKRSLPDTVDLRCRGRPLVPLVCQGRQVDGRRPALGPIRQAPDLLRAAVVAEGVHERAHLPLIEGQLVRPDLEQLAVRAEPRQWQVRGSSTREHDAEPARPVVREARKHIQGGRIHDAVHVVEDEQRRSFPERQPGQESRQRRRQHPPPWSREGGPERVRHRPDRGEGRGEIGEQDGGVVVLVVEGEPRH